MAEIQMFPQVFITLQEELLQHPDLLEQMTQCPEQDFPARLGFLAGLLEVLVDGYYPYGEIEVLADVLIRRMQERRRLVVLPFENKQLLIAGSEAIEAVDDSKIKGEDNGKVSIH